MSDDHLAITSLVRNICWLDNGNTCLLALCAGEAPDEKLKLGPYVCEEVFHIMNIDVPAGVGAPPLDTQLHVRKVLVFVFLQPGH